jgi:RNA binding exosome subunit
MSLEGYFDSVIKIWNSTEDKKKSMENEMKAVLRQFDASMSLAEISQDRIEDLSSSFNKIRKEVYK